MGSSVSVPRSQNSADKRRFSISSDSHELSISSPIKKKSQNNEDPGVSISSPIKTKSQSSEDSGDSNSSPIKTKTQNSEDPGVEFGGEETFFDTQAWLDSDCEDDFVSESAEFTPSSSNTPVPQKSLPDPQLIKSKFIDRIPELSTEPFQISPTDNKKRLSELLQESLAGEDAIHDTQTTPTRKQNHELENTSPVQLPKSTIGMSYPFPFLSKSYSVRSRDRTPNRESRPQKEKEKSTKPTGCCMPSLVTSLSFNEKRKRW